MSDNSRLTKNTILLYMRMLLVIAISLYTSRIVLQNLGIDDYGLYSVVGSVVTSFVFINNAMNSSTQRYLSMAIGKGDEEELHRVFNISRIIHALIGLGVVVICEVFGLWFIYQKMVMPPGRETAVMLAFQFSLLAVFVSMASVPFNALIISRERMGAFAYISIIDISIRLGIAYVISVIQYDRLIVYALLIAISQICIRMIYGAYCKKKFKESSFHFYRRDPLYKEMTIFASWGLLGHFSVIVNTSIQNMMLNVFFTPVVNAARGIALRVSTAVTGFNYNFQMAVSPQITKSYAADNRSRMFSLIYNSSRVSIYLMWALSLPIILCMDEILNLWLVEVPSYTNIFLTIVLLNGIINSISNPLNMAVRANGRIKYPEICGGLTLMLNLPMSYIALKHGCGPESVFIIMFVCSSLTQCLRIFFSNRYLGMPVCIYLRKVYFWPFTTILLSSLFPLVMKRFFICDNHIVYILTMAITCFISVLVFVSLIGINKQERSYVLHIVNRKVRKWS